MSLAKWILFVLVNISVVLHLSGQCITGQTTFKVDMRNETVAGGGVYFASSFQSAVGQSDWTPTPMCDLGSGIWEITFCGVPTGSQTYKFLNGPSGWEFDAGAGGAGVPGPCNTGVGPNDRMVTVSGGSEVFGPYCFNTCDILCSSPDPGGTDNVAPTILSVPGDITLNCGDPLPPMDCLPAMDNCFVNCTTDLPIDNTSGLNACGMGTIVRVWIVTDLAANSSLASQIILYEDNTPPSIDATGITDITVNCASLPAQAPLPASDLCDASLVQTGLPTDDMTNIDPVCGTGSIIRSWLASDCSGNDATYQQVITLTDNTAPTIDQSSISDITVSCGNIPPATTLPALDDCHPITDTGLPSDDMSGLNACGTGVIIRTWTASDCSQSTTFSQMITVEDIIAPIISNVPVDVTIECGNPFPANSSLSASDNCDATITTTPLGVDDASNLDACGLGSIIRTWTVTDCSNNTTSASQTISIEDNTAPAITAMVPVDLTISCLDPLPTGGTLTATDNCDGSVSTTSSPIDDLSGLDANGIGVITRSWEVMDCFGNTTTASQNITIQGINTDFDPLDPFCVFDGTEYVLPTVSKNGVNGTWDIPSFIPSNYGIGFFTITFMPDPGECGSRYDLDIEILSGIDPAFDLKQEYCISDMTSYNLPFVSENGIDGVWDISDFIPSSLGLGSHLFTFEPYPDQCASEFQLMIEVLNETNPTFPSIGPFCSSLNDTIILESESLEGIVGTWSQDTLVPSAIGEDTLTLVFTPQNGTCATVDTQLVIVSDVVPSEFDNLDDFCSLSSTEVVLPDTSVNRISGSWSPDRFIPSDYAPGAYSATFLPDSGQCAQTQMVDFFINPPLTPTFDPVGPFCAGQDTFVTLTQSSKEGILGTWNTPTFTPFVYSDSSNLELLFTPDTLECAIPVATNVSINAYAVSFLSNNEACLGTSYSFEASAPGGAISFWLKPNGDTVYAATFTIDALENQDAGQYCIEVNYPECTGFQCYDLSISPSPNYTIDSLVCQEDNYSVYLSSSMGFVLTSDMGNTTATGAASYAILDIPKGQDINIELTSLSGLQCSITDQIMAPNCGGCDDPAIIETVTAVPDIICLGDSTVLSATVSGGASSGTWLAKVDEGYFSHQDSLITTFYPVVEGQIAIQFITNDPDGDSLDCEEADITLLVNVVTPPEPPMVTDITFCKDSIATALTAIGSNIQWYDANRVLIGTTAPIPTTSDVGVRTYFVSQSAGSCESDLAQIQVTVEDCGCTNPVVITSFTASTMMACVGDTIDLLVRLNDIAYAGAWLSNNIDIADGISITISDVHQGQLFAKSAGTVDITYFTLDPDPSSDLCSADTSILTIDINPVPAAPLISGADTYCLGDSSMPLQSDQVQTQWYDANLNQLPGPPVPLTDQTGSTTYYAQVSTDGCDSELSTFTVTVNNCDCSDPPMIISIDVDQNQYCAGDTINVSANVEGPLTTLSWDAEGSGSALFNPSDQLNTEVILNKGGVYALSLTLGDPDGDGPCSETEASVEVEITEILGDFSYSDLTCIVEGSIIVDEDVDNIYVQEIGDQLPDSLTIYEEGVYHMTLRKNGCEEDFEFEIQNFRKNTVLPTIDLQIMDGVPVQLQGDVTFADSVRWTPIDFLDNPLILTPFSNTPENITYTLEAYRRFCMRSQLFNVSVINSAANLSDFLPNVFAPNGSGANATFGLPSGAPFRSVNTLLVWDRWGNVVFKNQTDNLEGAQWDGTYNGQNVSSGVYIYYIEATDETDISQSSHGSVTLIR